MGDVSLWPWIALGAWCVGFTTGIAWAAQWRPTFLSVTVRMVGDDDA